MSLLDKNFIKQNSYSGNMGNETTSTNTQLNNQCSDMPDILSKTLKHLENMHPNIPNKIITNVFLVKTFQMLSAKRIKYDESGKIRFPVWFALVLMQSGGGKDWLVDNLDKFLFAKYHEWYKNQIDEFFGKQLEDSESQSENGKSIPKNLKPQKIVEELQDATQEGLFKLGNIIKDTPFGSLFIRMSEFGLYMKNAGKTEQKFLSNFCQLYDCKIPAKIIKSEGFLESIENVPINILAYSAFSFFNTDVWAYFNTMLEAGLCRRFQISFQRPADRLFVERTDEEIREMYQKLSTFGDKFFEIFEKVKNGSCYVFQPSAITIFNTYCRNNNNEYNKEEIPLCKDEILSRCQKIKNLSCLFACFNHPQELVINDIDIKQAINIVEYLSRNFKEFYFHRPQIGDKYQKAYNFLKLKTDKGYTKTTLVSILQKECGFTREKLRKNFESEFIPIIREIANEEGFEFVSDSSLCKNGTYYYLKKSNNINMPRNSINITT